MMTTTVERVRQCRRRQRRGLELFKVEIDAAVALDGLLAAGLVDEPAGDEWNKPKIERALSTFIDRSLRQARKNL